MKPVLRHRKGRRAYRMTGFHAQVKALSRRGLSALDGRSALARAVRDWRAAVMVDLGGEADLSQAERTLLDVAAQDVVLLAVADGWLRENAAGVVNRRKRAFVPLVEQRLRVATHLADQLKLLGLRRRAKPVPSLREILALRCSRPCGSLLSRAVAQGLTADKSA
jgi:hypothetical protein